MPDLDDIKEECRCKNERDNIKCDGRQYDDE